MTFLKSFNEAVKKTKRVKFASKVSIELTMNTGGGTRYRSLVGAIWIETEEDVIKRNSGSQRPEKYFVYKGDRLIVSDLRNTPGYDAEYDYAFSVSTGNVLSTKGSY